MSTALARTSLTIGKGIDNLHDKFQFGEVPEGQIRTIDTLDTAINIDLDDVGLAKLRRGRTRVAALTSPHSFWAHPQNDDLAYFVTSGALRKLNADYSSTSVTTLSSNNRLNYAVVNGEVVVTNGVDIGWVVGTSFLRFSPVLGQFEFAMPAGQHVGYFRGCLLVARDNILYVSKPYNAEVYDERYGMFPLDSYIRMVAPVEDGIWIATSKHVGFISGTGSDEWEYQHRSDFVPPDGCYGVRYSRSTPDGEMVAYWAADGFIEGRAGGAYKNLSLPLVRIPSGASGSCIFRENNGFYQYIAVIRNDTDNNVYVADSIPVYSWHLHLDAEFPTYAVAFAD